MGLKCSNAPPPLIPLNWHQFYLSRSQNLGSNWKIADLTRSLLFKRTGRRMESYQQTMSLPNVSEVYMIAVVSIFGPAVTAVREVFSNIFPHLLTFMLHYSLIVFLPHSLSVRPCVGTTHVFCISLASHCFQKDMETTGPHASNRLMCYVWKVM